MFKIRRMKFVKVQQQGVDDTELNDSVILDSEYAQVLLVVLQKAHQSRVTPPGTGL
jgi:hypothetical protein